MPPSHPIGSIPLAPIESIPGPGYEPSPRILLLLSLETTSLNKMIIVPLLVPSTNFTVAHAF